MAPLRNAARWHGHLARAWTGWKPVLPFEIKRLGEGAGGRDPGSMGFQPVGTPSPKTICISLKRTGNLII
jgi:hypothetical protein